MHCSFLLWLCWFVGSPYLSTLFPKYPWFNFLFLYLLFVPYFCLGALLLRSHLRFPLRQGPPFGPSQFLFPFLALFPGSLSFGVSASVSFCSSSSSSCPVWVLFLSGFLFFDHVLLLFRGSLVWHWVSVSSLLSLPFFEGCRLRLLLFSVSAYLQLCLAGVLLLWWLLPTLFLSFRSLLSWPSVCLPSLSLDLFFCSGPLPLPSYPRLLSLWVPDVLLPWSLLLVLLRPWPCVVLVPLLRNSVESQFLRDGVLPLGRVISCGGSWGHSGLGHLWPLVGHPLPVLVDGSLLLGLAGLSSASVHSFGVPLLLFLHGAFRFPVWAGFLSFRSLL